MNESPDPRTSRELDLVLVGATGFAGRLVAAHLAQRAPADLRVALAGRSRERLADVRSTLGARAADWSLVVVDATDESAAAELAGRSTVVATTVGPYLRLGMPLAAACARAGTHYADLTGEVLFMRRSIEANDAAARESGARVVHACGFDSIPSDLGVHSLHSHASATGAGALTDVVMLLTGGRGGFSGGTVDSLRVQLEALRAQPRDARLLADPHALDPTAVRRAGAEADGSGEPLRPEAPPDRRSASFDADLGYWLAPFVMAPVNTRVVRRSHALLAAGGASGDGGGADAGPGYGTGFRYDEAVGARGRVRGALPAAAVSAATAAVVVGMADRRTSPLLDRLLPAPGEGPSARTMAAGYWRARTFAGTTSGRRLVARLGDDRDPGYGSTAVMFGESALCLALDGDSLPQRAGVLTPATAMGDALVRRLRRAGLSWEVSG